jgi:AraC family transcriptional regulator
MLRSLHGSTPVVNSRPIRTTDYSVEIQCSGPAALPGIYHNLHLVTVVLTGEAVVVRGDPREGRSVRLVAGDSSVRPAGPGPPVSWPQGIHCLHVHLHPRLLGRLSGSGTAALHMRPRLRDPIVGDIAFQLYRLIRSGPPVDPRAAGDLILALAHHVAFAYAGPGASPILVGTRSLEQVLDVFREQVPPSCRVDTIAAWCSLSRPHFSRRIRALTGLWPQTMILGSRIEAAKHLLERGEAPLSQVAYTAGFADQSHLTRVLRRSTGLTPAGYRASQAFKTRDGSSVA